MGQSEAPQVCDICKKTLPKNSKRKNNHVKCWNRSTRHVLNYEYFCEFLGKKPEEETKIKLYYFDNSDSYINKLRNSDLGTDMEELHRQDILNF